MEKTFLVQGSSPEPYEVAFIKKGETVAVLCSCPAAQNGRHCKHRLALIDGDGTAIISDNQHELVGVLSWLEGTDLIRTYAEYKAADIECVQANSRLAAIKRKLARVMHGG